MIAKPPSFVKIIALAISSSLPPNVLIDSHSFLTGGKKDQFVSSIISHLMKKIKDIKTNVIFILFRFFNQK